MKALILTNGDYGDYSFCQDMDQYDVIICADNGTFHAKHLQIVPDYILGDFDSSNQDTLLYFEGKCKIERFQAEKDETDTELALEKAISLGADSVAIYGGIGSRLDHTLGNVHLLYKALLRGVTVCLWNSKNKVTLIQDEITIKGKKGDLVSLLPFGQAVHGVVSTNLAYPLKDSTFYMGAPYGISNYLTDEVATVSIKEGFLLVMEVKD